MDNTTVKANQATTWRTVAPGWMRHEERMRKYTAPLTQRMMSGIERGHKVLDIATGVGDPAISIAEKVGPSGSVLATDLVAEMLAFAREKAAERGVKNIEFHHVDGEELDPPASSFDAVTMRFGLMFMPDPEGCLKKARKALKPGGSIALATWAAPPRNPWAAVPMATLGRHVDVPKPPPGAPGLFAFADSGRLESTIKSAGFSDVRVEEVEVTMSDFDKGADFWTFMMDVAGPIAVLFSTKVPPEKRAAVAAEIAREVEAAGGGKAHLKGVALFASGRA
ncbi:MAG: class I SAM-dependent methyltransferase [Acidobacteriia bacterium]|nr:class I SAM-dependent methyltransferase [Terriglobia bacterium]